MVNAGIASAKALRSGDRLQMKYLGELRDLIYFHTLFAKWKQGFFYISSSRPNSKIEHSTPPQTSQNKDNFINCRPQFLRR